MSELTSKLKDEILQKRQAHLESKIKRYPQEVFRASDIHECSRYLVYGLLDWKDKQLHNHGLQAIFDAGNTEENKVIKDLMEIGFTFMHQQMPFELKNKQNEVFCRGHIDGKILYEDKAIPCEIKSMNMNTFASLNSLDDFNKRPLHRKYLRQMQLYLYGNNEESGLFILSDLQGHYKVFVIELDYQVVEKILTRLELLWEMVKNKEYPDSIEFDEKICGYCPYNHLCSVTTKYEGVDTIEDDELEALLNRRYELKEAAEEFALLDKSAKNYFNKAEADAFVGTNFHIISKPYNRPTYDIPTDIKDQYKTEKTYYRVNISKV